MAHIPRKRFGQHFLVDGACIDAIVDAIDPRPGQALVEIGPGLGALTVPLLQRLQQLGARRSPIAGAEPADAAIASAPQSHANTANTPALTVIELDRDLAARLRRNPDLEVIEADVLTVDLAARTPPGGSRWRVVGNLPYNISSPILFHLLPMATAIVDQHFMLQKEVVDRMVAGPGGKDYGRLSVMLQWRYAMESVLEVPPEAFDPPPRVDSAVVRMVPRAEPPALNPAQLAALVQTAFSQRRKLLRHTLGPWLEAQGHPGGFDVQRRAEEVPVAEYVAAAQALRPR